MKDYGIVKSAVRPEAKVVDEYSVWVNTDIAETADGWEYHMVQYSKDEYIKLMDEKNTELESQLTDTQLALCDVYEMMGG
ncbi:hypothetical protein [Ruminococcus sp.]|uniref:hypothetical protein n=1 Tax=Ruminococcus sp. TaxID=41978 RepID=UPI002E772B37|nr:hypothetical protein [Ruminococcus sp.]MEE1261478.1 hypothetical protein [Ruminococcus sp.]